MYKGEQYYFESSFGHFVVFVIKLHPLLGDAADSRLRIVDELKTCDVGTPFSQVRQVNVQETLEKTTKQTWR